MHVTIVFIELSGVRLRGEPCKSLFIDIDAELLIRCDHNIDSQIKFVTIDK